MRKPALIVMVLWVLALASPALADSIQPLDLSFSPASPPTRPRGIR